MANQHSMPAAFECAESLRKRTSVDGQVTPMQDAAARSRPAILDRSVGDQGVSKPVRSFGVWTTASCREL
jgi:hypothetical protein